MRLVRALLACSLISALAAVAAADAPSPAGGTGGTTQVIGGASAKSGAWPDVAGILFRGSNGDEALCTGTLVAPTVVLTAGHCYDPLQPPLPDNVLIGTSSLARPDDGETIEIKAGYVYPDAQNTEDVTVLVLARPSTRTPRKIATGWARVDLVNGARISLVGYGATNQNGDHFVNELQEATTKITDFDCSTSSGCNAAARPAGELGAGGMGIDTCPGDSGGPLYLTTGYGAFLAGVTSRSYDDARVACSEGGIYERPDKIIDWIESVSGVAVTRGPEPAVDPIVAVHGDGGETRIAVNDPATSAHHFEITTPPAHGMARVRGDGAIRVCTDAAAAAGDDTMTVKITDANHDGRALSIAVPIQIQDGTPSTMPCDLSAFAPDDGGCCETGRGGAGGAIPLTIGVLALVMRRRR
jgi:secreted trypsin-like serine protease